MRETERCVEQKEKEKRSRRRSERRRTMEAVRRTTILVAGMGNWQCYKILVRAKALSLVLRTTAAALTYHHYEIVEI